MDQIVVLTHSLCIFSTFLSKFSSPHQSTQSLISSNSIYIILIMETNLNIDFKLHRSILKEKMKRDGVNESEDDELTNMGVSLTEDDKKKRAAGASTKKGSISTATATASSLMKICQAEKCFADLSDAKPYHRRHKVCEHHAKAQVAVVAGIRQRFCQQCSRFHELLEFDETKRSCRRRLAGHNERRRKNPIDNTEGGSRIKGSSTTVQTQAQAAAPSLLSSSSPILF